MFELVWIEILLFILFRRCTGILSRNLLVLFILLFTCFFLHFDILAYFCLWVLILSRGWLFLF